MLPDNHMKLLTNTMNVMKKIRSCLFFILFGAASVLLSCGQEKRDTEELVDPWLRERTPVGFRLESQIGAATITQDWRHDDQGSVYVQLVTGSLDMSAVKVVSIDFAYPESEYCPTVSIGKGSVLDLSDGTAKFTVTAYNGETRTYTVTYGQFKDPLEGVYHHRLVGGILDGGSAGTSMIIHGGWPDAEVMSTDMDKSWHWGEGYTHADEQDNEISFMLTEVDSETGATFGTVVNAPGDDGKYANYVYNNKFDVNEYYRQIPAGSSRWSKTDVNSSVISIYAADDTKWENPLYQVTLLGPGTISNAGKSVTVENCAFARHFEHADWVIDNNWPDTRWMVDNIRNTYWITEKVSDSPLPNHTELF